MQEMLFGHRHEMVHFYIFTGNEVSLQWYQPSLEHKKDPDSTDSSSPATQILALWAVNKKIEKPTASMMWIDQHQLIDLHDR